LPQRRTNGSTPTHPTPTYPFETHANAWCECDLPYRLLLPRGTADGMPARFLVLLTDAQQDGTAELVAEQCGSVLYCGRTTSTWPDKQIGVRVLVARVGVRRYRDDKRDGQRRGEFRMLTINTGPQLRLCATSAKPVGTQ
jgi:hypothetical protein